MVSLKSLLSVFVISCGVAMDLFAYTEPLIPWHEIAGAHSTLLRPVEKSKGLLQNAKAFAKMPSDYEVDPERRSFWDLLEFKEKHRKFSSKKRKHKGVYFFFCTVYYTPLETGFRADLGYDMTLVTKSGLQGKTYAKSFLKAVMMEGFGKLAKPVNGKPYIKFDGRKWGYDTRILGNRNNELVDRRSAAVHRKNPLLNKHSKLLLFSPKLHAVFGNVEWRAADTGGGLHFCQIDLYWGEDNPSGPGRGIVRPAGTTFEKQWIVPVRIEE